MDKKHTKKSITFLNESPFDIPLPENALDNPEGLCAVGGDLSQVRLINMYQNGFFPWYSDPDPILWWHPRERCVLSPEHFHLSKSMKKHLKNTQWEIKINSSFDQVIQHCANCRLEKEGTWISEAIQTAYKRLHQSGLAHSIEVWENNSLIGGFYGVCLGQMFFGESMFSSKENASKTALYALCGHAKDLDIKLIDCQVESSHLMSLGARLINREHFCELLTEHCYKAIENPALVLADTLSLQLPIR
ncbi:leucyl/phenylalanyl-tRNA--protein transferase [Marinomonas sp. 15G1-11]|uniref:Leucyl/phenylalanyl-tRNA--protein transferase n=1 Tax=Marinomonas phaeophyticola TaxID=3004091 RepID=A0ABT4JXU6_9GAMM|nr:leucyl/phenylalanyl-tRNA--protein transferase [Marinomonas sp. 15G1-11]MCZ2723218.1 leucyl/phenylalanyl-tRNA--protein transferase [Marinomonas sp. 15G1-11]